MPHPAFRRPHHADDRLDHDLPHDGFRATLAAATVILFLRFAVDPTPAAAWLAAGTLPALVAFVVLPRLSGRIVAAIRTPHVARHAADLGRFMPGDAGISAAHAGTRHLSPHA